MGDSRSHLDHHGIRLGSLLLEERHILLRDHRVSHDRRNLRRDRLGHRVQFASCRGDWFAWGRPRHMSVLGAMTADFEDKSYLQVPSAEDAVVEDEGLIDQVWFGELNIRIPAHAH